MSEITTIPLNDKFKNVILLDEYNGTVSIVAARESKDGKTFPQWVFPQDRERKPRDKAIPLKVNLGDRTTAARHLRYMADVLEAKTPEPDHSQPQQNIDDDDIPF